MSRRESGRTTRLRTRRTPGATSALPVKSLWVIAWSALNWALVKTSSRVAGVVVTLPPPSDTEVTLPKMPSGRVAVGSRR